MEVFVKHLGAFLFLVTELQFAGGFHAAMERGRWCYGCLGTAEVCQVSQPGICPMDKPYCLFSYNRYSGIVIQHCADPETCGLPRAKRELMTYYDPRKAMVHCCNYDHCNCIGIQCKPLPGARASKIGPWPIVYLLAAILTVVGL